MKEKRLLYAIGWVKDEYLEEMQQTVKRYPRKKLWLMAAIIALLLFLVGCAAAFLWLQDRSIGQETYTQRFDAQGHYIEPTEKTMDTVTLFGSSGSNMQKALAHWLEFKHNYPSFSELNLTEKDAEKIPERYRYTYDCYTPEMVDELERIAAKYDLELLTGWVGIQRYQYESAMESLGLTSLLRSDARATMDNGQGTLRLPYNFDFEFFVDLTGIDAAWATDIYVNISYAKTGYFPGFGTKSLDLSEYEQWQYTAVDGTPLLLALNQKGQGLILAERENATIYIEVDGSLFGPNFPSPDEVIDQRGLEQLADAFDYGIQTQSIDMAALQSKLTADQAAYNQKMQDAVITYAGFTEYLLEKAHGFPTWYYCFYDLDGNGEEELLLGSTGTGARQCVVLHEGKAWECGMWFADLRPLENGGLLLREMPSVSPGQSRKISYTFYKPLPNGAALTFGFHGQGSGAEQGDLAVGLIFEDGIWKKYYPMQREDIIISESEAQAIIGQYPEAKLDWQPVWDYPIDVNGRTIGDELSSQTLPQTEMEYIQFYAEAVEKKDIYLWDSHTHFALRDMNSDGILDILLSADGTSADFVFTWQYGGAVSIGGYFSYLCEDNVMCLEEISSAEDGADLKTYHFQKFAGNTLETVAHMQCNLASGQWMDLTTGTAIDADAAQEIISSYPAAAIEFRPIGELRK